MSMMQELNLIKKQIGEKEFALMENFLQAHPYLLLTDLFYNAEVYENFVSWKNKIN